MAQFHQDKKDSILKKIKGALDKASSAACTPEEAQSALLAAQAMLQKYNIEMSDIETFEEKEGVQEVIIPFTEDWEDILINGIRKYNFCDAVKVADGRVSVVGKPTNIQVVIYLNSFFRGEILRLSVKAYSDMIEEKRKMFADAMIPFDEKAAKQTLKNKFIKEYTMGCVDGVLSKMKMQTKQAQISQPKLTALMVVNDKEVAEYMQQKYPNVVKGRKPRRNDSDAYGKGHKDGSNIQARTAIDPVTGKSIKLIE